MRAAFAGAGTSLFFHSWYITMYVYRQTLSCALRAFCALLLVMLTGLWAVHSGMAQDTIELWPEGAPGAVGEEAQDTPTLTIYLPEASATNGAAVVVCPGGGYAHLAMDHEGRQVAEWLNERGVAAFVLKYRLGPRYGHPSPLMDAQRAMRYVRAHAGSLGVDPVAHRHLGFLGGRAPCGDDLHARCAGRTRCGGSPRTPFFPAGLFNSRVSGHYHDGSLHTQGVPFPSAGGRLRPRSAEQLSNEKRVNADTPPAFLFHTGDDAAVPVENSTAYYLALREAGVPAELHIYLSGPHGVGLAPADPVLSTWPDRLEDWMRVQGVLGE